MAIAEEPGLLTEEKRELVASATKCSDVLKLLAEDWNGLRAEAVAVQGQRMEAEYRPRVLQACIAAQPELLLSDLGEDVEGLDLWLLRIPRAAMTNAHEDGATDYVQYLASNAQYDIFEIIGADTIPCAFIHVESTPAIGPFHQALIGFDAQLDERDRLLLWMDRRGHHGGDLRFALKPGAFAACARITALMKNPNRHAA